MSTKSLMVVEDNPINGKIIRKYLTTAGYDVRHVTSAEEALAELADWKPRLILMDIQLPGIDGLDLTRRLKNDPQTSDIHIIALTAYALKGDEEKTRAAGCDGYISKPIDFQLCLETIAPYFD